MYIKNEVSIGSKVYFLKRIKENGSGSISISSHSSLNGELIGILIHQAASNVPKYEVGEGEVCAIHVDENSKGVRFVFEVKDSRCIRKLTAKNTWLDREAAQKQCDFLNLDRRMVPIERIQIPQSFAAGIPCNEKLVKRLDEWRESRKLETEIYVDENLNLIDGYTSYLVYRMFGIMDVPVVVWPDGKRL